MGAILSDGGLSAEARAAAAGRALHQPGLPVAACRTVLVWLMERRREPAAGAVLAGALSWPAVQAAVETEPQLLDGLLPAAAEATAAAGVGTGSAGPAPSGAVGGDVPSLSLSALPHDRLIGPAAAAAARALSASSSDSTAAGPLFRRLCDRLSTATEPTVALRVAYLTHLLIPSVRLGRRETRVLRCHQGALRVDRSGRGRLVGADRGGGRRRRRRR